MVNVIHQSLYPQERNPASILQEVGWAPVPVWMGAANLAPTGFRSPYRPALSKWLYRLTYSGPLKYYIDRYYYYYYYYYY
jgi:hypothetical protein